MTIQRLKILILSDYAFTKGGAERVAISSALGLSESGHEVVFFSAVGPVEDELAKAGLKEIICLGQKDILDNPNKFDALISGIYNWRAIKGLRKLFYYWIPDVVHVHGVSKALSWGPINLLYKRRIPIVYTLHDYGLICPNMGIYNYRKNEICPYYRRGKTLKCFFTNCDKRSYFQKLWRWSRYFIIRNIFRADRKISGYVAVSRFMENIINENLVVNKPVRTIYNPVDAGADMSGQCTGKEKTETDFLYVGRLSQEKGIDMLLGVMSKIDARLTIIGDGELMDLCRDYAERLGREKIKILGYQDRKRIFDEMRKASALILPSRCIEPAPLVPLEAACNCLPSIVADRGGITEFVEDGVNGLYFKAGSAESLKESMEKIMKDPIMAERMGQKARESIVKKGLGVDDYIEKIDNYYADIIENRN